ncbi:MAG: hypothetical protein JOZ15_20860 [Acidobacteria bacterium]|nr:hypothetical protein [Acidobacteriota bacterium]
MIFVLTALVSIGGSFFAAFFTIGNWVRADVQAVRSELTDLRREVKDLRSKVEGMEHGAQDQRKELEAWSARRFTETCSALKGKYDYNLKICVLDGQVLKYEPPYL